MPIARVFDTHLRFDNIDYFRGNATAIALGSYGRKKSPLFGENFLEVDANLNLSTLAIAPAVVVDLDTSHSRKGDVTLNLSVVGGTYGGNVSGAFDALATNTLKLVQFAIPFGDLRTAVSADPAAMADMTSFGHRFRVAHQIWVVMQASEAQNFTGSMTLSATIAGKAVKLTATANDAAATTTSITLSAGSTYAYLLCQRRDDGTLTTDQWGL